MFAYQQQVIVQLGREGNFASVVLFSDANIPLAESKVSAKELLLT